MADSSVTRPAWLDEYRALVAHAGLVSLQRTQIELAGADRASFMHNLCTNEIRKLPVGSGCEAFLTSVQGKTLGHVFVFVQPETIVIDTVGDQGQRILAHLDHYLISEKVTLTDRSQEWAELFLGGPSAERILRDLARHEPPKSRLANVSGQIAGRDVWLRQADIVGPGGFLVSAASADLPAVSEAMLAAGAVPCGLEAFDAARIEWGFPWFGRDLSEKNLPQELARDKAAISFVKGCYLGQETVARIDALGHVNKVLAGFRFAGTEAPAVGEALLAGEQAVGELTSCSFSPRLGAPLALGYVRQASSAVGTRLRGKAGEAEIVALPVR